MARSQIGRGTVSNRPELDSECVGPDLGKLARVAQLALVRRLVAAVAVRALCDGVCGHDRSEAAGADFHVLDWRARVEVDGVCVCPFRLAQLQDLPGLRDDLLCLGCVTEAALHKALGERGRGDKVLSFDADRHGDAEGKHQMLWLQLAARQVRRELQVSGHLRRVETLARHFDASGIDVLPADPDRLVVVALLLGVLGNAQGD
mmetsp:Transcript_5229/g.13000  ORF Transcript_5229/g.13000 Transcript_5229/m.13000 type:complete len:204 (+) Transcript_5229:26-637(+)